MEVSDLSLSPLPPRNPFHELDGTLEVEAGGSGADRQPGIHETFSENSKVQHVRHLLAAQLD